MDRELTEAEKITLANLELLGWKVFRETEIKLYSNGTNQEFPNGHWSGEKSNVYLMYQYDILRLYKKRLVYSPKSDKRRGIWSHEFHYTDDYLYLLPNGQVVYKWSEACDIVANKLGLGFIEGSEYEGYRRSR
jgi:hypothetical protein